MRFLSLLCTAHACLVLLTHKCNTRSAFEWFQAAVVNIATTPYRYSCCKSKPFGCLSVQTSEPSNENFEVTIKIKDSESSLPPRFGIFIRLPASIHRRTTLIHWLLSANKNRTPLWVLHCLTISESNLASLMDILWNPALGLAMNSPLDGNSQFTWS